MLGLVTFGMMAVCSAWGWHDAWFWCRIDHNTKIVKHEGYWLPRIVVES